MPAAAKNPRRVVAGRSGSFAARSASRSGHLLHPPQPGDQEPQHHEPRHGADQGRNRIDGLDAGPRHDAADDHGAHQQHAGHAQRPLPVRHNAEHACEEQDRDAHADEQRRLVVGAERGNGKVLHPRRREVDERRAQRNQGRCPRGEERADQFRDGQDDGGGGHSGHRGQGCGAAGPLAGLHAGLCHTGHSLPQARRICLASGHAPRRPGERDMPSPSAGGWTCSPAPRGHVQRWSPRMGMVALCPVGAAGTGHVRWEQVHRAVDSVANSWRRMDMFSGRRPGDMPRGDLARGTCSAGPEGHVQPWASAWA